MSFRLVPNSVTLNDLERRNSLNGCVISPNLVYRFLGGLRKSAWLKIHRHFLRQKCRPNNVVLSDVSLMTILAGDEP